ncbi:hypothetical protein DPMN_002396 [Dreissena polymorpha]|uniref:Uncharacterized protein n=1 Tax=Dreissena polymorpha TaxID=45954 RepID=A0A9D4MLW8_DREPO|nr:hypothetical protein DPMN_002396 [Dreissena polymorpha]
MAAGEGKSSTPSCIQGCTCGLILGPQTVELGLTWGLRCRKGRGYEWSTIPGNFSVFFIL